MMHEGNMSNISPVRNDNVGCVCCVHITPVTFFKISCLQESVGLSQSELENNETLNTNKADLNVCVDIECDATCENGKSETSLAQKSKSKDSGRRNIDVSKSNNECQYSFYTGIFAHKNSIIANNRIISGRFNLRKGCNRGIHSSLTRVDINGRSSVNEFTFDGRTGTNENLKWILRVDGLQRDLRRFSGVPHLVAKFVYLFVMGQTQASQSIRIFNDKLSITDKGEYAIIDIEGKKERYKIEKRKLPNNLEFTAKINKSKDLSDFLNTLEKLEIVDGDPKCVEIVKPAKEEIFYIESDLYRTLRKSKSLPDSLNKKSIGRMGNSKNRKTQIWKTGKEDPMVEERKKVEEEITCEVLQIPCFNLDARFSIIEGDNKSICDIPLDIDEENGGAQAQNDGRESDTKDSSFDTTMGETFHDYTVAQIFDETVDGRLQFAGIENSQRDADVTIDESCVSIESLQTPLVVLDRSVNSEIKTARVFENPIVTAEYPPSNANCVGMLKYKKASSYFTLNEVDDDHSFVPVTRDRLCVTPASGRRNAPESMKKSPSENLLNTTNYALVPRNLRRNDHRLSKSLNFITSKDLETDIDETNDEELLNVLHVGTTKNCSSTSELQVTDLDNIGLQQPLQRKANKKFVIISRCNKKLKLESPQNRDLNRSVSEESPSNNISRNFGGKKVQEANSDIDVNRVTNHRDSWERNSPLTLLEKPRRYIESGNLVRKVNNEAAHKRFSWNILDLKSDFNNNNRSSSTTIDEKRESLDLTFLFQKYEKERDALHRPNRNGSISDFSEISSLSDKSFSSKDSLDELYNLNDIPPKEAFFPFCDTLCSDDAPTASIETTVAMFYDAEAQDMIANAASVVRNRRRRKDPKTEESSSETLSSSDRPIPAKNHPEPLLSELNSIPHVSKVAKGLQPFASQSNVSKHQKTQDQSQMLFAEGAKRDQAQSLPNIHFTKSQNALLANSSEDECFSVNIINKSDTLLERTLCHNTKCSNVNVNPVHCRSCSAQYCSRECRLDNWTVHKRVCLYGRIDCYVRAIMRKCENDKSINGYLRKKSADHLHKAGRGCLHVYFESPTEAKICSTSKTKMLKLKAKYVTPKDLKADKQNRHNILLLQSLQDYDPEQEFVMNICVQIGKPEKHTKKHLQSAVFRCVRIPILLRSNQLNDSSYFIRTFSFPNTSQSHYMNTVDTRRYFCREISFNLRRCGVQLKEYPEAYTQLCHYVEKDITFLPLVLYGQLNGRNYKCALYSSGITHCEEPYGGGMVV